MSISKDPFVHARDMKRRLDQVSPSFCLAKWLQVNMHLTTGQTQSCFHPPTHKIPLEELSKDHKALHNTEEKKAQRKLMRKGLRPEGCDYCWKVEDAPGDLLSDRAIRSNEPWAKSGFDEVVFNSSDYNINPRYVEVNFNHTCNFKCSYCSPHLSTSWAREAEELGPYPTLTPHNDYNYLKQAGLMPIKMEDNPYVKAFWEWWPELYKDIRVFRMTGGEPLIDKNTFKVLDWVINHPRPDLELAITSNMCPPESMYSQFIEKLRKAESVNGYKKFTLFASVDTFSDQAEYIRDGLNFDLFWKNIKKYLDELPNAELTFVITMNLLSLPKLKQLLQAFLELQKEYNTSGSPRLFLDTPFLRDPQWLSLQILPEDYHHYLEDCVSYMREHEVSGVDTAVGFRSFWIGKVLRAQEWMKGDLDRKALRESRVNFFRFFKEYDLRRNKDFLKTFPEYSEFWALCQSLSAEEF